MSDSVSGKNIFFKNQKLKEAFIVTFIFFALELILISFHEMWRDEIATWSLCFNCHSLKELLFITRYEGHPKLWFIIVYFLQMITGNIFYMQLVHICIAAATVFIFCFYSPFSLVKNILFCFGYFFVYEYAVLSRNYAIEIFFLFLTVSTYTKSNGKSIILASVLLFFLFQTSLYAVIIGIVFYCYMILSEFRLRLTVTKKIFLSSSIILCGLIFSVLAMIPPPDGGMHNSWNFNFVPGFMVQVSASVFNSYFPLPRFKNTFWNSNFLDVLSNGIWIQFFLALLILVIVTFIFYDNKKILFLFHLGTLGFLSFYYFKYLGNIRHHGQLFLLFVICCWLYFDERNKSKQSNELSLIDKTRKYFLSLILVVNLFAAGVAIYYEMKFPFSNALSVCNYLKSDSLSKMTIAGDGDAQVSSIAGLINKKIYYLQTKKWSTYVEWDTLRKELSADELITQSINFSKQLDAPYLLVLCYPVSEIPSNWQFIKSFNGAIVKDENYFLYLVKNFKPIKE